VEHQDKASGLSKKNINRIIIVRYMIILLGIAFLLIRHQRQLGRMYVLGPYFIFIIGAVLNTVFAALVLHRKTSRYYFPFVILQITVDTVLISGLVFFTGGIFSAITSFYFASILAASMTLTRKHSIIFASLSITLLSCTHILYAADAFTSLWGVSLDHLESDMNIATIVSKLLFHAVAFYTVAILSGTLANMLRSVKILNIEILENISEGLLVIDSKRKISFFNNAFCSLFDFREEDISKNTDAANLFAHEHLRDIQGIVKGDLSKTGEISLILDSGPKTELNIKASELKDRKGERKGLVILFEDISPHKQIERALLRIDRYRAIVEMSAGIAHEIRNPLASIRGCADELVEEKGITEENVRLFNIIKEESDRLSDIISDFYTFLKDSPPSKEKHDLKQLILDTIDVARQSPVFKDIEFHADIQDGIIIKIDKSQWKQVFLNLFLNAAEAMSESITVTTSILSPDQVAFARKFVSLEEIKQGIQIEITDTGKGISRESLSHIFIPFYTTKEAGIGVGLSIVNRIIRSHGGIIDVHATGHQGTTFVVTLPIYKEQEV